MRLIGATYLMTLTALPERGEPTRENWQYFQAAKRMFVRWLQRNCGSKRKLQIGWRREISPRLGEGRAEATQGNRLHVHALIDAPFVNYARAQEAAKRCGLGVVDFKPLGRGDTRAANYVVKYMTKDVALEKDIGGRRFALSPGLNLPSNPDWSCTWTAPWLPALAERVDAGTGEMFVVPAPFS